MYRSMAAAVAMGSGRSGPTGHAKALWTPPVPSEWWLAVVCVFIILTVPILI